MRCSGLRAFTLTVAVLTFSGRDAGRRPDWRARGVGDRTWSDSPADAAALHDDGGPARWGGDPRRPVRRSRLLGDQRHAQHRSREAREGRSRDEPEPRDIERDDLLVHAE